MLLAGAVPKERPAATSIEVLRLELDERFAERCAARARARKTDVVAYVLEAPPWTSALVQSVRGLPAEHALKDLYVQFLKDTYGYQIARVSEAYAVEASSFTDLGSYDWRRFDSSRAAVRTDDDSFLGWLAEWWFRAAIEGVRREDREHPVVSPYLDAKTPRRVIQAASAVLDVLWLAPDVDAPRGKTVVRWTR